MKEISLTQGKVALVDDEDFERLSKFKWMAYHDKTNWYACRQPSRRLGPRKLIRMHTDIIGALGVDHKNQNGLDNRRSNLRLATTSQNAANSRLRVTNKSGTPGVCWHKCFRKWQAQINRVYLGRFTRKNDAVRARRDAEQHYFGDFAGGKAPGQ